MLHQRPNQQAARQSGSHQHQLKQPAEQRTATGTAAMNRLKAAIPQIESDQRQPGCERFDPIGIHPVQQAGLTLPGTIIDIAGLPGGQPLQHEMQYQPATEYPGQRPKQTGQPPPRHLGRPRGSQSAHGSPQEADQPQATEAIYLAGQMTRVRIGDHLRVGDRPPKASPGRRQSNRPAATTRVGRPSPPPRSPPVRPVTSPRTRGQISSHTPSRSTATGPPAARRGDYARGFDPSWSVGIANHVSSHVPRSGERGHKPGSIVSCTTFWRK